MNIDVNEEYNKNISARTPEGKSVEAQLTALQKFFNQDDRVNEAVDEIGTIWRLKGFISLAQARFIDKLYKRFC